MKLESLLYALLNFAANPLKSWGEPTSGDLVNGQVAHVAIEPADRNSARLSSGTYTRQQLAAFRLQCAEIERTGQGVACFSGDPHHLPGCVPMIKCSKCTKLFRSMDTGAEVKCYDCTLSDFCPELTGRHISASWCKTRQSENPQYAYGWYMEARGDIGFRNEMCYQWHNRNSAGNLCHQDLLVRRNAAEEIYELVFRTLVQASERCYAATFDVKESTVKFTVRNATSLSNPKYTAEVAVDKVDPLVIALMVAMMPEWMLYEHSPKHSDVSGYPKYPEVVQV